jgi:citrate lyase subunit beta/citryl-CoA lyase
MSAPSASRPRRAVLSVPASEPRKITKALAAPVDEVVVDLEDAVAVNEKDAARENVAALAGREHGRLAVRVNAIGTPWHEADVLACVDNPAVDSIVLPKAEDPQALRALADRLDDLEASTGRAVPLEVQALVESPAGVQHAVALAAASDRVTALILGYADLSASMGRRVEASWLFAQDAVLLAARLAGAQAIDGPQLTIADDEPLATAASTAEALGFDGKWVIHPAQVGTVQRAFTPSGDEAAEAREIVAVLDAAAAKGRGALQWRGRMLDEAVAVRARRTLGRAAPEMEDQQ